MEELAETSNASAEVSRGDQSDLHSSIMDARGAENAVDGGTDSTRRAAAASMAAAALLAACGGGGGGGSSATSAGTGTTGSITGAAVPGITDIPAPGSTTISGYTYPIATTDQEAARLLLQAQFSASTDEIAAVRTQGYKTWLMAQLNAPATMTGVEWLDSRGYNTISASTGYFDNTYPGDFMIWQQLMKSSDAVRKRLALALSEVFVVSLSSLDFEWRSHGIAQYWDVLVDGTRGNFRTLLEDITLNPAMGYFLNTRGNQKENTQGRQPDENYAREVMQLFTLGLYKLNINGTEERAADGSKLASYTQSDVSNLARVFTGYDLDKSQNVVTTVAYSGYTRDIGNATPARRRMVLTASRHSMLPVTLLDTSITNTDGTTALGMGLDTLFNHPNVGPFLGKQMIQRLVTSNPSPDYVARVAAAFNDNGAGVRGDMKAMFAAILLDDEARSPAGLAATTFGKLREPMLRFVQWGRTFGLNSAAGSWKLDQQGNADQLGQSPLRAASVFNFFRPGYIPPSTALATGQLVAPEFQIVNETTVGAYLNYLQDRIRNGFNIDSPAVPEHNYTAYARDITASYTAELALVLDTAALVRRINLLLCAGQLSAANQTLMVNALNATTVTAASSNDIKLNRVCAAVLMVMACSEYLVQK